jgi:hypothetical protein
MKLEKSKEAQPIFEPIKYEDYKKEEGILEIYKNQDYNQIVPLILDAIDHTKNKEKSYGNYPYFRTKTKLDFLPKLDVPSDILNTAKLKQLYEFLPDSHQYSNLYRIFSMTVDGCALKTFYNKCQDINNSILVIKDDEDNVFGGYASECFEPTRNFSGTGECFLFTFYNGNKIHVFNSTGINRFYMYCDDKQVCFGCSDDYFSLSLRNDFLEGYTQTTQTYQNLLLSSKDKFTIVKLELWGFE